MISARNVLKSKKVYGKYERPLIRRLKQFFQEMGYEVVPHASLNISWGSIISDIDLLLIKGNKLTAVEVKSSKDKVSRAYQQLENIRDFVDYLYIASDSRLIPNSVNGIGIVVMTEKSIHVKKKAKRITDVPSQRAFALLHRKCLLRLADLESQSKKVRQGKFMLAGAAVDMMATEEMKGNLQEIAFCGLKCSNKCPIRGFEYLQRN